MRLRWAALGGPLATASFAAFVVGSPASRLPMAGVVGLTGPRNLALARSHGPWALPAALHFDLAALLANTGGAREPIQRVLADCGGDITHAAEALGIHRRSLQRKLSRRPSAR